MARRRSRRRKSSYEQSTPEGAAPAPAAADLSPRARRLVESGVIDLGAITGSGEGGKITSGDILHAARVMEMERSVARIETVQEPQSEEVSTGEDAADEVVSAESDPGVAGDSEEIEDSDTSTSVAVGGEPIAVPHSPWEDYNGSTEGLSESARPGADQSWGEAEAHLAAMAEEAASADTAGMAAPTPDSAPDIAPAAAEALVIATPEPPVADEPAAVVAAEQPYEQDDAVEPGAAEEQPQPEPEQHREVMMDFGTLELVEPESVWAEGAEDFAPWFLAHSQQLGDVLGLKAGLADARQFTTKSATGVLGRDDSGEDVVVVSSKNATADDSDLGHALGMAASSGAASVALVSAAFEEDQLKALAWLNNQTKSGVKWYGIEMRVVRIADSPAAMLFDLVAAPPTNPPTT